MKKKSFISNISLDLCLFQIIIYILDCVIADNKIKYCSSEYNYNDHIIDIGRQYFRYISFASFSNRNMILLTTALVGEISKQRIFYGLKENGRPLFNDSYYFYTQVNEQGSQYKFESQSLVI